MKFTNEQVGELVDRLAEYLEARKKLRKCFKETSGSSPSAYFCQFESDARDATLTALTRELNAVLPSEFTAFDRDREAQERAKKDPWRDGYPPWEPIPPEQKGGQ